MASKGATGAKVFLACLASLRAVSLAQSITGAVTDPDSGVVKDAIVQAKNTATGAVLRATSSLRGEYAFAPLPPGVYDLSITMPCCQYGSATQSGVALRAGEPRRVYFPLPGGATLGTAADDPILLLNEF